MVPASLGALGLGCSLDTTGLVGTKDAGGAVLAKDAGSGADAGVGSVDGADGNDAAPAQRADGLRIESATFSKVVAGSSSVSLLVTGRGIVPGAQVRFDNLVYPLLRSGEDWVADQIQLPATGGKYLLTIANPPPDGQEDSRFMTVFWPAPTVTTVTASRALAGATNVSLSVTGTGFVEGAQVILGSVFPTSGVRSAVFKSSTELRVDGISLPATVGEYSVLVSNPEPTVLNGTSAKLTVRSAISSCAALKRVNPIAPSGVHFVDPDGKGPDLAFPVYCEMNDDGSAWALLFTMVKADGSLCSDNSGTKPASCVPSSGATAVEPNTGSYLSKELAQRLALGASRVHLRSQGQRTTRFITSVANRRPILNLRAGIAVTSQTPFPEGMWTGPNLEAGMLSPQCNDGNPYPVVFHAGCNEKGVHFGVYGSSLQFGWSTWNFAFTDEAMEVYVGGEASDEATCAPGFHDSNGATAGGDCFPNTTSGTAAYCATGYTDNNGSSPGGVCVSNAATASCAAGYIDSNGAAAGGACVVLPTDGKTPVACLAPSTDSNGVLAEGSCILPPTDGVSLLPCEGGTLDSNGALAGGRCVVVPTDGVNPMACELGATDSNGPAAGGTCIAVPTNGVTAVACTSGTIDSNGLAAGGHCVSMDLSVSSVAGTSRQPSMQGVTLWFQGTGFQSGVQVSLGAGFSPSSTVQAIVVSPTLVKVEGVTLPSAEGSYSFTLSTNAKTVAVPFLVSLAPTPGSCKDLLKENSSAVDGIHLLRGNFSNEIYSAWCDMTHAGGGWTLALKVDGRSLASEFFYDKPQWTTATPHQGDESDLAIVEAKLRSYSTVPLGAARIVMVDASGQERAVSLTLPSPAPSLFDAVTAVPAAGALAGVATSGGRAAWLGLYPGASLQPFCNAEGFNVDPGTYIPRSRVRLGIVTNGENDCISPDSYLGVGGELMSGNQCTVGVPSGGYAAGIVGGGGCDGGDVQGGAFAYVFVREP